MLKESGNNLDAQPVIEEGKGEPPPSPKRNFEYKVLREMQEFADAEAPKPEKDWGLIWVLSGSPIDIAKESVGKDINESRERLKTGLKIAREVTAVKMGKDVKDVTPEDILENGPDVFWNATDDANDNLKQRIGQGLLEGFLEEGFNFPKEKLVISEGLAIEHTGHQFERFPEELKKGLEGRNQKMVIVSDVYHLPRVRRTLEKNETFPEEKVVLYPSEPRTFPLAKVYGEDGEIRKILPYMEEGKLPKEELPDPEHENFKKIKRNKK